MQCLELGKVVSITEGILLSGKNLETQQDVLEILRGHLEEALYLMTLVNQHKWFLGVFNAHSMHSGHTKFEDIAANIQETISLLSTSVADDTAARLQANFRQVSGAIIQNNLKSKGLHLFIKNISKSEPTAYSTTTTRCHALPFFHCYGDC